MIISHVADALAALFIVSDVNLRIKSPSDTESASAAPSLEWVYEGRMDEGTAHHHLIVPFLLLITEFTLQGVVIRVVPPAGEKCPRCWQRNRPDAEELCQRCTHVVHA